MSFTVHIQKNNSENESLTKNVTDLEALKGELTNSSSIIDPVIMIQDVNNITLRDANYMYISAFGRKYFITDIINVRTGLWEIHGHVDVLSSFASEIKSNTGIISRQEKKWNLYLDDGLFKTYQNPNIVTKKFPTGFSTTSFVLAVAGG